LADPTRERGQPARVLLVDDDPDIRAIYGGRLRADGFEVSFAADGRQALAAVTGPPAIILLDLRMPGMNGLEVLGQLKRNSSTAHVPVVMLSNDSDPATMATCAGIGAVAWWSKSALAPAELSRRVRELVGPGAAPA
jgi:two-component system, OmpR family, response regulator MtrA